MILNQKHRNDENRYLILNQKTSKQRKPVFDSKAKNIERRTKHEHRYSALDNNKTIGNQLEYVILTFVQISESTESKVSNVFPSRFHRLFSTLSQLGLPSSAHDLLLVTLLINMPISILFSLFLCLCPVCTWLLFEVAQASSTVTSMSSGVRSSFPERPSHHRTPLSP